MKRSFAKHQALRLLSTVMIFHAASMSLSSADESSSAKAMYAAAVEAQDEGRWEIAVTRWQAFLKAYPEHLSAVAATEALAGAHMKAGQWSAAVTAWHHLEAALKTSDDAPRLADCRWNRAAALYRWAEDLDRQERAGDPADNDDVAAAWERAAEAFRTLKADAGIAPPRKLSASFFLAEIALTQNRPDVAAKLFAEVAAADPAHEMTPTAIERLAARHAQQSDFEAAITRLQDRLRRFPDGKFVTTAEAELSLIDYLLAANRNDEAIDRLRQLIDAPTFPHRGAAMARAVGELTRVDRLAEAKATFGQLVTEFPNQPLTAATAVEFGRALTDAGRPADARDVLHVAGHAEDRHVRRLADLETARAWLADLAADEAAAQAERGLRQVLEDVTDPADAELRTSAEFLLAQAILGDPARLDEAARRFRTWADAHPDSPHAAGGLIMAADAAIVANNPDAALTCLSPILQDRVVTAVAEKLRAHQQAGRLQREAGDLPAARRSLAIFEVTKDRSVTAAAGRLELASVLEMLAEHAAADALLLSTSTGDFPEQWQAYAVLQRAGLHARQMPDAGLAIRLYGEVLRNLKMYETPDAVAYEAIAFAFRSGHDSQALAWADRLTADFPDSRWAAEANRFAAHRLAAQEKYQDAIALADWVTRNGPAEHRPAMLYLLGVCHARSKQLPQAVDALERLLTDHGEAQEAPNALYALAVLKEQQGKRGDAITRYTTLVEQHPETPVAKKARQRLRVLAGTGD